MWQFGNKECFKGHSGMDSISAVPYKDSKALGLLVVEQNNGNLARKRIPKCSSFHTTCQAAVPKQAVLHLHLSALLVPHEISTNFYCKKH